MAMLPYPKGKLTVPRSFEIISAGDWKKVNIADTREMVGAGNVSTSIFILVSNPPEGRSYIGNFDFPNLNEVNMLKFQEMIKTIKDHEKNTTRVGAYISGASFTGRRSPDGIEVDEVLQDAREFAALAVGEVVGKESVFCDWLPDNRRLPFVGLSPEGKFFRLEPTC